MRRTIVACVIVALVAGASSAAAAKLITGADIKNGSITGKDLEHPTIGRKALKKEAVIKKKLSAKVQDMLEEKGAPGPQGPVGPKGDPGPSSLTKVSNLNGPFTTLGTAVALTPDGVAFGPYADGGTAARSGSVVYSGLNGKPLSSVRNLVYYARYVSDRPRPSASGRRICASSWRSNAHDAIFSPNTPVARPRREPGAVPRVGDDQRQLALRRRRRQRPRCLRTRSCSPPTAARRSPGSASPPATARGPTSPPCCAGSRSTDRRTRSAADRGVSPAQRAVRRAALFSSTVKPGLARADTLVQVGR